MVTLRDFSTKLQVTKPRHGEWLQCVWGGGLCTLATVEQGPVVRN